MGSTKKGQVQGQGHLTSPSKFLNNNLMNQCIHSKIYLQTNSSRKKVLKTVYKFIQIHVLTNLISRLNIRYLFYGSAL